MECRIETPKILNIVNNYYLDILGYKPEQTSLQQIPENQWNEFAIQRGLNPNSSGIYLPRNQTAIIQEENPLSLFHEYFGHGLYCEQSLIGRKLVNLEKKLLEEEKQEFSSSRFTLEDIQDFRQQNQTFKKLEDFRQVNLERCELFAIWTEYLLSGEHDLRDKFGRKYDALSGKEKEAIDSITNFSTQYGDLATMYAQGMARRTTIKRVERLLRDIYKDKLKNVRFALLYGSRKSFSDIDVFMVGEKLPRIRTDWLDIVILSHKEFEEQVRLFDIESADALMNGEIILGDKELIKKKKIQLMVQPITLEAIKYNIDEGLKQREFSDAEPDGSKLKSIFNSYYHTFLINAYTLGQGQRIFSKKDLLKGGLQKWITK